MHLQITKLQVFLVQTLSVILYPECYHTPSEKAIADEIPHVDEECQRQHCDDCYYYARDECGIKHELYVQLLVQFLSDCEQADEPNYEE